MISWLLEYHLVDPDKVEVRDLVGLPQYLE